MVDKDVMLSKIGSVRKYLKRIKNVSNITLQAFLNDVNTQDIILFNIQLAVQNCIDIAAHIVSEKDMGIPGSANEIFYFLEENKYINNLLTEKMVKAVGFRNLIVHEYGKLDLKRAYDISQNDIKDLDTFLKAVIKKI
ncbi:type VII toxin-antitoxin system HepT family RNase toxin [Desulfobacula sp.]|uniref:type VII toxin-antitoxin system HepT family RNase toxin n=1 Tax=Desulfobacula sp. TaxID=2593537 RepID=UPI0039B9CCA1|nr:DUF86 domain-containing protein [Desulfobacula sp.]